MSRHLSSQCCEVHRKHGGSAPGLQGARWQTPIGASGSWQWAPISEHVALTAGAEKDSKSHAEHSAMPKARITRKAREERRVFIELESRLPTRPARL